MTTQNKFAFFANFAEAIKALPEEKQAGAYRAICEYGIYGELPSDPIYLGLCLMAKASIYKEDGRSNNGGNHNPKGINQHSDLGQSGKSRSNQVNSGQSGQIRSIPLETETETETRNGNKKQETEKYGELGYVRLTDEQYTTLKEKYPNLDEAIEVLDTWLGKNSKSAKEARGKNHYAYFKQNSWVWERVGEMRKPVESITARDSGQTESISDIVDRMWREQNERAV